jgi:hypothetical protein
MASVEAVARENGSVIEALGPAGLAVFRPTTRSRRCGAGSRAAPVLTFAAAASRRDMRAPWAGDAGR